MSSVATPTRWSNGSRSADLVAAGETRVMPDWERYRLERFGVADEAGVPVEAQFWDEAGSYIDFTLPRAAEWWREQVKSALLDYGIVATWNDNNEYEIWDQRARFTFRRWRKHLYD